MKVLVICDDKWHPAEVIQRGMGYVTGDYQFDYVMAAKDILTPAMIKAYPVIINAKGNAVTAANEAPWFEETVTEVGPREFREYVAAGGGFIALHAGNTYSQESCPEYAELVGNSFVTHPLRCPVEFTVVGDHPITKGAEAFTERDEHYEIGRMAADIVPFLETRSIPGGTQMGGYVRKIGAGRLCVLTPGHTLAVWQNKNFRRLLTNAIDWCAGRHGELR